MICFHETELGAPTTRRYPRSLAEAFPEMRADSGDWVTMPSADIAGTGHRLLLAGSTVGLCVVVVCMLMGWL